MALFRRKGFVAALIFAVAAICLSLLVDTADTEFWLLWLLGAFATAIFIAIYIGCPVITGMKGKYGLLFAGLFLHPCWTFGAIRLAKPDSYWARRFYGSEKMNLAQIRFTPDTPVVTGLPTARPIQGP